MAGLYIHVPLCGGQRCIYCDFYSTLFRGNPLSLTQAYVQELKDRLRHDGWDGTRFRTLYFGGGTPSQLAGAHVKQLLADLSEVIDGSELEEITLEANPEDVTPHYLRGLFRSKRDLAPWRVNRVSLGVQSFDDAMLTFLGRRHDAARVGTAVRDLRERGVQNISIDLMYGLPGQTMTAWRETIARAIDLGIEHVSAYALSVEPGTPLASMVAAGRVELPDEELVLEMASHLRFRLEKAGYVQYEISNYARPGFESRHNSAYWTGEPYLGLGPGAHSYDGRRTRSWNAPDLAAYLMGRCDRDHETLTDTDLFNERIMLGLRTRRGVNLDALRSAFPGLLDETAVASLIEDRLLCMADGCLRLTGDGLAVADNIIRRLFAVPQD